MTAFVGWLRELLVLIPVLLVLFVSSAGFSVALFGLREMKSRRHDGPPGYVWQSMLFVAVLDIILLAGLDVAKFREFFTEAWGGIVGVTVSIFGSWMGMRAAKVFSPKGGGVDGAGGQ